MNWKVYQHELKNVKLIKYYSIIKKLKSDKEREEKKDSMKKKKTAQIEWKKCRNNIGKH